MRKHFCGNITALMTRNWSPLKSADSLILMYVPGCVYACAVKRYEQIDRERERDRKYVCYKGWKSEWFKWRAQEQTKSSERTMKKPGRKPGTQKHEKRSPNMCEKEIKRRGLVMQKTHNAYSVLSLCRIFLLSFSFWLSVLFRAECSFGKERHENLYELKVIEMLCECLFFSNCM